jgi:excisionase family DNA binding protein
METYLTADQAGTILQTSGAAVRAMIRGGQLRAAYIGRRWLIDPADLRAMVAGAQGAQNAEIHPETRTNTY